MGGERETTLEKKKKKGKDTDPPRIVKVGRNHHRHPSVIRTLGCFFYCLFAKLIKEVKYEST